MKKIIATMAVGLMALGSYAYAGTTVCLITKTDSNPFFVKMKEGAQAKADELGMTLKAFAGKIEGDNETQVAAIETCILDGAKGILITPSAMNQLARLCGEKGDHQFLRVGVRSGGCSGMSYTMDFVDSADVQEGDEVYEYQTLEGTSFKVVCDQKSLLYIYGMQLDFSNELIGGGFNFTNPNATQTCGCGSSFAV